MEETETSVARWADGNRSLSLLSLTNCKLSSSHPANKPDTINTGNPPFRAARAHSSTPLPVRAAAFP